MFLWQLILAWLTYAASLAGLAPGQESDSPPVYFTFQDGRQFEVTFHSKRVR